MGIDWVGIMDVAVATLCGALVGVAGSIFVNWLGNRKGYKDINAKLGKLDNTTLSGQHEEIKDFIEQKAGKLDNQSLAGLIEQTVGKLDNTTLSGQNITLLAEIRKIQAEMDSDRKLKSLKRQQLTGDQAKINQSITALAAFSNVMADLQSDNLKLRQETKILQEENLQLKQQLEEQGIQNGEGQTEKSEIEMM
jgi:SMC interacting uncharacterized protein involved in chromosome segregation